LNFKLGHDIESSNILEIGHFMEHLFTLFTSDKYPIGKDNRSFFYLNNIDLDAEIETKNINFTLEFKLKHLDKILDIVCNALIYYKVDEELFYKEQNAVIEELNEIIEDNNYELDTKIDTIIYKNHQRSINQKKRLENCKKLKPIDLTNYFRKYFVPKNLIISASGNINHNRLSEKINLYFINIPPNLSTKYNSLNKSIVYKKLSRKYNEKDKIIYNKKDTSTASLKLYFKINYLIFDKEIYTIVALLSILTDDLDSIILKRLRGTEGLVYYLNSGHDCDEFDKSLSFVSIESSVNNKNLKKVINIIFEELDNIKNNYIEDSYINKYIEKIKIEYTKSKYNKHPGGLLESYSKNYLWDKPIIEFHNEYKNYINIDKHKLKKMANEIFDTNNCFICYNGNQKYI
jgi:predicted Zn-dependent peptidase